MLAMQDGIIDCEQVRVMSRQLIIFLGEINFDHYIFYII